MGNTTEMISDTIPQIVESAVDDSLRNFVLLVAWYRSGRVDREIRFRCRKK